MPRKLRVSGTDRQQVIRKLRYSSRRRGQVLTIKSLKLSPNQRQTRGNPIYDVVFTTRKRRK